LKSQKHEQRFPRQATKQIKMLKKHLESLIGEFVWDVAILLGESGNVKQHLKNHPTLGAW
jgi:ribosomal protein S15P/S13E